MSGHPLVAISKLIAASPSSQLWIRRGGMVSSAQVLWVEPVGELADSL